MRNKTIQIILAAALVALVAGIILVKKSYFMVLINKGFNHSAGQLYVINVLDKDLYDDCHIKGSINVPFESVVDFANKLPKDTHVVFYCSNYWCTASSIAVKLLKKLGFHNVWAYEGGTAEWYQLKKPVQGPCKKEYLFQPISPIEHDSAEIPVLSAQELEEKMSSMAA